MTNDDDVKLPEPLFLLHCGDADGDGGDWDTEALSGRAVDDVADQHRGQTLGLYDEATVRRLIAEAVAREREACADEADHWIGFDKTPSDACDDIARAIRNRSNA